MSVKKVKDTMNSSLIQIQRKLLAVPKEAFEFFRKTTPIDSGNARKKTSLKSGNVIHADYEYAQVLDRGRHMTSRGMRGSTQAKDGMSKPTAKFIDQKIKQILRK